MKQHKIIIITITLMSGLGFIFVNMGSNIEKTQVGYSSLRESPADPVIGRLDELPTFYQVNPDNNLSRASVILDRSKVYSKPIFIKHSNIILNCNHAKLTAGITVTGKRSETDLKILKNVTIKNCVIEAPTGIIVENALRASNTRPDLQKNLIMETGKPNWYEAVGSLVDRRDARALARSNSPSNITIQNVHISNANMGVYIGQYVNGVRLVDSTVRDTTIAVHLSYSSAQSNIQRNHFFQNGERKNSSTGTDREAIVIDGSGYNYIKYNIFTNNKGEGIRTYKNCGEAAADEKCGLDAEGKPLKCKQGSTREEGAHSNTIIGNLFQQTNSFYEKNKNKNYRAISIASRQDRNSIQWMCSDGYFFVQDKDKATVFASKSARLLIQDSNKKHELAKLTEVTGEDGVTHSAEKLLAVARDYSGGNTISNNYIRNFGSGAILIQDHSNIVTGNYFKGTIASGVNPIMIGNKYLGIVGDPVINTTVNANCVNGLRLDPKLTSGSSVGNNRVSHNGCGVTGHSLELLTEN